MHFLSETILPVLFFTFVVLVVHRSRFGKFFLGGGLGRTVIASVGVLIVTLIYWQLLVWGYFYTYSQVAAAHGHQALGQSWDIRLTYSLSFALILLLVVAVAFISYEVRVWKRGRSNAT